MSARLLFYELGLPQFSLDGIMIKFKCEVKII